MAGSRATQGDVSRLFGKMSASSSCGVRPANGAFPVNIS